MTTEKLRDHYKAFFHPDNAEALLVGDFDIDAALAMFDREFGALQARREPIPQVITVEPPQEGERRALVKRPGTVGLTMIGYIRPGALHPDFIALEVLDNDPLRRRELAPAPGAGRERARDQRERRSTSRCAIPTRCSSSATNAPGKIARRRRGRDQGDGGRGRRRRA